MYKLLKSIVTILVALGALYVTLNFGAWQGLVTVIILFWLFGSLEEIFNK